DQNPQVVNIFFTLADNNAANAYKNAHPELTGVTVDGNKVIIPVQNVDITTPTGNTIHIDANGAFTYTAHFNNNTTGQDDDLHYTMKDGDGDTATAELLFNIDSGVSITNLTAKAQGGDAIVNEDDLLASRGPGESAGSDPVKESTTVQGNFNISAPDGVGSLTIGGQTIISNDVFTAKTITTSLGNTLNILSYDAGTGLITYSYTLNDNQTHPLGNGTNSIFEDFNVALTDKDGDSGNNVLSIQIIDDVPNMNVSASGVGHSLVVDESNLAQNASANYANSFSSAGNYGADGAGSTASSYSLSISANGANSGLIDSATGQGVILSMNNGTVEGRTSSSNALVFTVSVDNSGNVVLDQIRALQHPNASDPNDAVSLNADNLVKLTRTDSITDADGDTATGSATINIGQSLSFKDDAPIAVSDQASIQRPALPSYNLVFTLDVSGSMGQTISGTNKTRLQLLKEAITSNNALLDSYVAASAALHITIVTFSTNAQNAVSFDDVQSAKNYINSLSANGQTNYTDALAKTETAINANANNHALDGYINKDYFISDGQPNVGVPNSSQLNVWQNTIAQYDYDAIVLNIAPSNQSSVDQYLAPIANPGDSPAVIHVASDLSNLQSILVGTIEHSSQINGNVLTNDTLGADNSAQHPTHVSEVDFTLSSSAAAQAYLAAHPELVGATTNGSSVLIPLDSNGGIITFATPNGGILKMSANGDFFYTAKTDTHVGDDIFTYKIIDGDGDVSSTQLTVHVSSSSSLTAQTMSLSASVVAGGDDLVANHDEAYTAAMSSHTGNVMDNDIVGSQGAKLTEISFMTADANQYIIDHHLQGINAVADADGKTVHIGMPSDGSNITFDTTLGAHLTINNTGQYSYDINGINASASEDFNYVVQHNDTKNVQTASLQMNVLAQPDTIANLHGADSNHVMSTQNHSENVVTMEGGSGNNEYIIDISELSHPDKIMIMDLGISKQNILTFIGVDDNNHDGKTSLADAVTGFHQDSPNGNVTVDLQNHSTLVLQNVGTVQGHDVQALEQHLQNVTQELNVHK
ncbi:MAG: VWA domain-containing protein, partial [Gammaproteobacteria bacterium]|nr:VWA domain-containing protein [Gammaproteobacteria bacterium]